MKTIKTFVNNVPFNVYSVLDFRIYSATNARKATFYLKLLALPNARINTLENKKKDLV